MPTLWRQLRAAYSLGFLRLEKPDSPIDEKRLEELKTQVDGSDGKAEAIFNVLTDFVIKWPGNLPLAFKSLQSLDYILHACEYSPPTAYSHRIHDLQSSSRILFESSTHIHGIEDPLHVTLFNTYLDEIAHLLRNPKRVMVEKRDERRWNHRMERVITTPWRDSNGRLVASRSLEQDPRRGPSTSASSESLSSVSNTSFTKTTKQRSRSRRRDWTTGQQDDAMKGLRRYYQEKEDHVSTHPTVPEVSLAAASSTTESFNPERPGEPTASHQSTLTDTVSSQRSLSAAALHTTDRAIFETPLKMDHRQTESAPVDAAPRRSSMPVPRRQMSDLIRDSKLETTFDEDGRTVCHISYITDIASRQRRVKKEDRWVRHRRIGAGGFGCIWLEKRVDEQGPTLVRAVKEIYKQTDTKHAVDYTRELEAIAKFSHEKYSAYFVRSSGWYEDEQTIFISMEYYANGDLGHHMKTAFPEIEAREILSQILEGLALMHDNGFAHRDLKPGNIFVVDTSPRWWVKIGDFGISKRAEEATPLRTVIGTPAYLAPEVSNITGLDEVSPEEESYTEAVDLWAVGMIAFQLLTNKLPFSKSGSLKSYVLKEQPFPREHLVLEATSEPCMDLIERLVSPSPAERPSAPQALEHPWLLENDEADLRSQQRNSIYRSGAREKVTTAASAQWPF